MLGCLNRHLEHQLISPISHGNLWGFTPPTCQMPPFPPPTKPLQGGSFPKGETWHLAYSNQLSTSKAWSLGLPPKEVWKHSIFVCVFVCLVRIGCDGCWSYTTKGKHVYSVLKTCFTLKMALFLLVSLSKCWRKKNF